MNLNTRIAPQDVMFNPGDENHYFSVGDSAMSQIRIALQLAGNRSPIRILDFPSGYGRVLRKLRVEYPTASITACDIDLDAVKFCAKEFNAIPVAGSEDYSSILLENGYDLIWCGSLLTHLNHDLFRQVLHFMAAHLTTGGVMIFTTHGRRPVEFFRRKLVNYLAPGEEPVFEEMIHEFEINGFSYRNYGNQPDFGISLSKPAWVVRQLESLPELRLLLGHEAGWDNHQDVFACVKGRLNIQPPSTGCSAKTQGSKC